MFVELTDNEMMAIDGGGWGIFKAIAQVAASVVVVGVTTIVATGALAGDTVTGFNYNLTQGVLNAMGGALNQIWA